MKLDIAKSLPTSSKMTLKDKMRDKLKSMMAKSSAGSKKAVAAC